MFAGTISFEEFEVWESNLSVVILLADVDFRATHRGKNDLP
jgi:hypothetical protein